MNTTVAVRVDSGWAEVQEVGIVGVFAVTPTMGCNVPMPWTLTHLPTGLSVGRCWATVDGAREWATLAGALADEGVESTDPHEATKALRAVLCDLPAADYVMGTVYDPDVHGTTEEDA